MQSYFSNAELLKTPGKRAAYSDRTAYMMAEMSRLAYFRFEGGQNIKEILESIKKLTSESSELAGVEAILKASLIPDSEETGKKLLGEILEPQGYELDRDLQQSRKPGFRPLSAAIRPRILRSSLFAVPNPASRTSKQTSKPIWSRLW